MTQNKDKVEGYLNSKGIKFRGIPHNPAASAEDYNKEMGTRFTQQVKVLLVKCKKEGQESYCVVALQGHKKADLNAIAKTLGVTKARLADKDQLNGKTGCSFGELHPFSSIFNLPLLLDEDFFREDEVFINAGQLDYSVVVSPKDIEALEKPLVFSTSGNS